ncbi:MAG: pentapeptide repeat-containing protein [Gaiellaceae bacterium]
MANVVRAPYPPDLPAKPPPVEGLVDLVDAVATDRDWANERAPRVSLQRVELRRCRLVGAELAESTLRDVTLSECRLDLVGLRHATLERVAFSDCKLTECDFYGSRLKDVLLERCELQDATFSGCRLERVELRGCDLTGVRGSEALRGARMPWADVVANAAVFAAAVGIEIVD